MSHHICNYHLPSGDRRCKRIDLVSLFLQEEPGCGTKESASTYTYNVESWDSYTIYLCRPAHLNFGFDFTVNVSDVLFGTRSMPHVPSHNDIVFALKTCLEKYPYEYSFVREAIFAFYNCQEPFLDHIHAGFFDCNGTEHPIQILLLAIKWLFMEQDCTYWNYSGRMMLFNKLRSSGLV